jgi:predicted RNase H-related nuclease YkuK (DUF458 family)
MSETVSGTFYDIDELADACAAQIKTLHDKTVRVTIVCRSSSTNSGDWNLFQYEYEDAIASIEQRIKHHEDELVNERAKLTSAKAHFER